MTKANSAPTPKELRKGILLVLIAGIVWALAPLFVKHFSSQLDDHTQNACRYFSGGMTLLAFSLILFPKDLAHCLRVWPRLLVSAIFIVSFQTFWVKGINTVMPGSAVLISKVGVIWSILTALFIFPEERGYIRKPAYLLGNVIALAGVVGVVCAKEGLATPRIQMGLIHILLGTFFWNCYAAWTQKMLRDQNTFAITPLFFLMSAAIFGLLSVTLGEPSRIFQMSGNSLLVLYLSGAACIALTHSFFYTGIRLTGMALGSSILLVQPLITILGSYIIFKEALAWQQMLSGTMLLIGLFLAAQSRRIQSSTSV